MNAGTVASVDTGPMSAGPGPELKGKEGAEEAVLLPETMADTITVTIIEIETIDSREENVGTQAKTIEKAAIRVEEIAIISKATGIALGK
jgi:hypothetical protein